MFGMWKVHYELSKDLGKTWNKIEPAPVALDKSIQTIQPSILLQGSMKKTFPRGGAQKSDWR